MYGCESWTIKKAEWWRIDAFELSCWRRLLWLPWTARRSNQSILKEINSEYSLEGLMLKLRLQNLPTWCKELSHWKRPQCLERLWAGGEGDTKDETVRQSHSQNGHEFEQTLRDSGGQRSLACCSSKVPKSQTRVSHWATRTTSKTCFFLFRVCVISHCWQIFFVISHCWFSF